jgi:peptide-methionine (S)-S-oxide reductase
MSIRQLVEKIRSFRYATALLLVFLADPASSAPPASAAKPATHRTETATFAGGCFWSMNAIFERLRGVERVTAGFSGGSVPSPSYERVCTGSTGHAESVQITFDPAAISYGDLLHVFFAFHDPTTLNRQGADEGPQYRSAVFWHTPEQRDQVTKTIAELAAKQAFKAPIVTQVLPYKEFYPAEGYHQGYYDKHSGLPYCQLVIAPKVAKLRKLYGDRLKPSM